MVLSKTDRKNLILFMAGLVLGIEGNIMATFLWAWAGKETILFQQWIMGGFATLL